MGLIPSFRIPPAAWFTASGLAQHWVARRRKPTTASALAAAGMSAPALWLLGGSVLEFVRRGTSVDPVRTDRASELVRTGPNAVTRNPMYVGMAALLLGHAAARRSLGAVAPAAAFVWAMDRCQIPAEEESLAAAFPTAFPAYAAAVPRWLGRRDRHTNDGCQGGRRLRRVAPWR